MKNEKIYCAKETKIESMIIIIPKNTGILEEYTSPE